ncbi:unnamed protein product, partial [Mesorhabditis spiculigera]
MQPPMSPDVGSSRATIPGMAQTNPITGTPNTKSAEWTGWRPSSSAERQSGPSNERPNNAPSNDSAERYTRTQLSREAPALRHPVFPTTPPPPQYTVVVSEKATSTQETSLRESKFYLFRLEGAPICALLYTVMAALAVVMIAFLVTGLIVAFDFSATNGMTRQGMTWQDLRDKVDTLGEAKTFTPSRSTVP